jgi:hypothetical protein
MSESKHKGAHVTETPDVSYIKNVEVTHETSDVSIGGIAKFAIGLLVLTIAIHVAMWGLFWALQRAEEKKEPPPPPMALSAEERLPPEPRLQGAPGFGEELEKTAKPDESESATTHANVDREPVRPKDPLWEIKQLNAQWNDVLEHGPVDQNGKRYGMPIEKAKEEILKQGLPVRKQ